MINKALPCSGQPEALLAIVIAVKTSYLRNEQVWTGLRWAVRLSGGLLALLLVVINVVEGSFEGPRMPPFAGIASALMVLCIVLALDTFLDATTPSVPRRPIARRKSTPVARPRARELVPPKGRVIRRSALATESETGGEFIRLLRLSCRIGGIMLIAVLVTGVIVADLGDTMVNTHRVAVVAIPLSLLPLIYLADTFLASVEFRRRSLQKPVRNRITSTTAGLPEAPRIVRRRP